ncbi:MAG: YqaJ-like viral recombinase [Altererythrobacter sp.]|nr:YqaJ-like viral recombinase [Altererythrobacter sp.]
MTIKHHDNLIQGSDEWHHARCGLLTASEFGLILTPKLKIAENAKKRAHMWELAAQRISGYVEPQYVSDAMLRGHEDEILARDLYSKKYAKVREVGFVTNDEWGFTLGCSPDGLVGDDGMIEVKSRGQKFQVQTIVEYWEDGTTPDDFTLQVQGGLLVTGRKWCDLISYSGGLPMVTMRIEADADIQNAIIEAATMFEEAIANVQIDWYSAMKSEHRLIPTERRIEEEMII